MSDQAPSRVSRLIVLGVATTGILLAVVAVTGLIKFTNVNEVFSTADAFGLLLFALAGMLYSVIGVLILFRYPSHVVGRLFLIAGFASCITPFGVLLEPWITAISSRSLLVERLVGFTELIWIVALFTPLTLVLQYFPNGRLPSRRWWPLPVLSVFAMVMMSVQMGVVPARYSSYLNPVVTVLVISAIVGSLTAAVVQFRRSRGVERQQMKWLVYVAVVGIGLMILLSIFLSSDSQILGIYGNSLPSVLALTMGFAILRYRLFDIDIVIRKTLQYGLLTAILAVVYFGLIVLLQTLFSRSTGEQSPVIIVVSTLTIAALFTPLCRRVQDVIDRRFFRKKYDAQQVLAQFAQTARDETDIAVLQAELLHVVHETLQPEHLSVWLKKETFK